MSTNKSGNKAHQIKNKTFPCIPFHRRYFAMFKQLRCQMFEFPGNYTKYDSKLDYLIG